MTHRKHSHAFATITLTVTCCLLLWDFQLPARAGGAPQVEPLEAAPAMKLAAASGDGKAVIQSFARVQESCVACQQAFRKPFVEHFNGAC